MRARVCEEIALINSHGINLRQRFSTGVLPLGTECLNRLTLTQFLFSYLYVLFEYLFIFTSLEQLYVDVVR